MLKQVRRLLQDPALLVLRDERGVLAGVIEASSREMLRGRLLHVLGPLLPAVLPPTDSLVGLRLEWRGTWDDVEVLCGSVAWKLAGKNTPVPLRPATSHRQVQEQGSSRKHGLVSGVGGR